MNLVLFFPSFIRFSVAEQDFKTEKPNPFIRTFLLEYERMVGFLTFCKNHMSWKNVALDL